MGNPAPPIPTIPATARRSLIEFCSDAEQLQRLNAIVHPAVMEDFDRWAEAQQGHYVVLESAILFEAGLESRVDATVAVMAPEELRVERVMARDGATKEQ
ncbi:MAG: dephospho-CoA kinase, partial [Clostridia bacterium]|nr:dephospho-CoA kinase [Clostridia bacterium]